MHFERSLYRVYEAALWRLANDPELVAGRAASAVSCGPTRCCRLTLGGVLAYALLTLAVLCTAHTAHVGNPGCLAEALATIAASRTNATNSTEQFFSKEAVFRLRVQSDESSVSYESLLGAVRRPAAPPRLRAALAAAPADVSDSDPAFAPHYVFSGIAESVTMGQLARVEHGYPVFNITLPLRCGSVGVGGGVVAAGLVSYDTVAVNSAMYSFPRRAGYLVSTTSGEVWNWPPVGQLENDIKGVHAGTTGAAASILVRLSTLLLGVAAFFVLSSLTALFLRVLMVSGPAVIWPAVIGLMSMCGARHVDLRELNAAYPWIGINLRYLAAANVQPTGYLLGHVALLVLVYVAYAAGVSLWTSTLLAFKTHPSGLWEALALCFLLAEWFSLTFLRSRWGILVFPRVFAALWLCWVGYYGAYPYGLTAIAAMLLITLTLALMLATVLLCEAPALRAGDVSLEKPRAFLTVMPAPAAPVGAPLYESLFMPLNYRVVGVHDAAVPPLGATLGLAEGGGAAAAAAGGAAGGGGGAGGAAAMAAFGEAGAPRADGAGLIAPAGGGSGGGGRRPLLDQDELRASGHAEQFT